MTARYEVGELVDISIKGARVHEVVDDGSVIVTYANDPGIVGDAYFCAGLHSPAVRIERIAPAEWPPQPGDLWEDRYGSTWFAFRDPRGVTLMKPGDPNSDTMPSPDTVLTHQGPMTLAYRKGWTPTPAAADPEKPEHVDERAALVAGLRELADWLEANPDVPADRYTFDARCYVGNTDGMSDGDMPAQHARLEQIAAAMGVDPDPREQERPSKRHRYAIRVFSGGVNYTAVVTEAWPQSEGVVAPQVAAVTPPAAATPDIAEGGGEVAGPVAAGPATGADEVGPVEDDAEHALESGWTGPPGQCGASCKCGVTYDGFSTHAEASAMVDAHIAEAGRDHDPAVEPDADGDLIAPAKPNAAWVDEHTLADDVTAEDVS